MCLFFEKVLRSGIYYISKKYCKGSNKYLKPYDPNKESKPNIYLEANNYAVMPSLNFFQHEDLDGSTKKIFTRINKAAIV